jgi:hypothetical protein
MLFFLVNLIINHSNTRPCVSVLWNLKIARLLSQIDTDLYRFQNTTPMIEITS